MDKNPVTQGGNAGSHAFNLAKLFAPLLAIMLACACAPMAFAAQNDEAATPTTAGVKAQANSIADANVTLNDSTWTYTGKAIQPVVTVKLNGATLVADTDYTVAYSDNKDAGKGTVTVTGIGNYTGKKDAEFTIAKAKMSDVTVAKIPKQIFTGKALKPKPTVTLGDVVLSKGADYALKYSNNKKVGKGKIVITGKGNIEGKKTVKFTIGRASLEDAKVGKVKNQIYTGDWIRPTPKVKLKGKTLKKGRDYTISWWENKNAGTASLKVKGKGNYRGSKVVEFTIEPRSIDDGEEVSTIKPQVYTGGPLTPLPKVTVKGRTLTKDTDYTLRYENNREIGTAKIYITGKGNYKDAIVAQFQIVRSKSAK